MVRSGIERDMTLIENVDFDLAMSPVLLLSIDMVDSMLKSCPSRISDSIGCDVSNCDTQTQSDQTRKNEAIGQWYRSIPGIGRRANCTGRNALGPTKWLGPQANSRINRTKLTERLLALASVAEKFFWRSAHTFGSVDGLDARGDEVAR